MTADHRPRFGRHRVKASRNQTQHVGEQTARAVLRVELYTAEAVGRADAAAERFGVDFDDPHLGEFGVAELIGLVAAFEEEAAGSAADLLSSLREDDFGTRRHGHQELLLPLGAQMMPRPPIHEAGRNVVRQRKIADLPDGEIAAEPVRLGELKVEGKIGRGDRLVPTTASVRRVHRAGRDGGLHQASGSSSLTRHAVSRMSRLRGCTRNQTSVH